jgi:hypothetical protein
MVARRGRAADPRPRTSTSSSQYRSRPRPSPRPAQRRPVTATARSTPAHPVPTKSTQPRLRALPLSARAVASATPAVGGAATTSPSPSIRAPTTVGQSGPGYGTRASRSSGTPISAAATAPRRGTPTTPLQRSVPVIATAIMASSSDADPVTLTVAPRRNPTDGRRLASSSGAGNVPAAAQSAAAASPARRTCANVAARLARPAETSASTRSTSFTVGELPSQRPARRAPSPTAPLSTTPADIVNWRGKSVRTHVRVVADTSGASRSPQRCDCDS